MLPVLLALRAENEKGRERYPAALHFQRKRYYKSTNAEIT
jgi:hypothetical protein